MDNKFSNHQIAEMLAAKTGKPVAAIEQFLTAFASIVNEGITNDQIVKIKGVGIFKVTLVKERESVHVNTGERIIIPPHHKVSFLPEKNLKDLINKPFAAFEAIETREEENGFMSLTLNEKQDDEQLESDDSQRAELDEDEEMLESKDSSIQAFEEVAPDSVQAPTVSMPDEPVSLHQPPVSEYITEKLSPSLPDESLPLPPPISFESQPETPPLAPQYNISQPPPPPALTANDSQPMPPPPVLTSTPPPVPTHKVEPPPPPVRTSIAAQPSPTPSPIAVEEQPPSQMTSASHRSHSHSHHSEKSKKKSRQSSTKALWIILFFLLFVLIAGAAWYFFFYSRSWDEYASKLGSKIKGGEEIAVIADSIASKQSLAVKDSAVNMAPGLTDSIKTTAANSSLSTDSLPSATTSGQAQPTTSSQPPTTSQQPVPPKQEPAKAPATSSQSTTSGQNRPATAAQSTTTGQERPATSTQQTSPPRQGTTQPSPTTSRPTTTLSASNKVLAKVKMEPGERLTLLAERYYGLKVFWVYIYDYNKASIGPDPNRIRTNMEILIPAKEVYGIDATSNESIAKATEIQRRLVTGEN